MDQPCRLAITTRGGSIECEHFGHIAICATAGRIEKSWGDPFARTFMRSSAKPLQAATALNLGTRQRFAWDDRHLAVVCASHSAQSIHRALVRGILTRAGLHSGALQCGPHLPLDPWEQAQAQRRRRPLHRLDSNCSGKHAGMLAACRARSWPVETYRQPDHPLQQAIRAALTRFAGADDDIVQVGTDGCGVPTFSIPMAAMATAFARLANPASLYEGDRRSAQQVVQAMTAHPQLIAGTGRLDTRLTQFAAGAVVVKSGAEGVLCLGLPGLGLGVAIKTSDGSNRAHAAIVANVLASYLTELDWSAFLESSKLKLRNTRGEAVGAIEAAL